MTELENILFEIATNQVEKTDLETYFDRIAILLLQQSQIVSKKSVYNLNEIEFYFSSEYYDHIDPYTHSNIYKSGVRQLDFGEWYFHRFKSMETYPLQKFRGIDLTFGSNPNENYGGILIRRIQNISTGQIIDGISNIVKSLIEDNGIEIIEKLATERKKFAFDNNSPLHIRATNNKNRMYIYKGLRHKLSVATTENESLFFNKYYCYSNDLNLKIISI